MLFLIQWLGGIYCCKKMWDNTDTIIVILCIFFGWLFILIYLFSFFNSDTSSSSSSSSSSTYTKKSSTTIPQYSSTYTNKQTTLETSKTKSKGVLFEFDTPGIFHYYGKTFLFDKVIINRNFAILFTNEYLMKFDIINKSIQKTSEMDIDCDYSHKYYLNNNSLMHIFIRNIGTIIDIWYHFFPYNEQDMCNTMTNQMNNVLKKYNIITELSSKYWLFFEDDFRITLEECVNIIPKDAPFEEPKTTKRLNLLSLKWHQENINMKHGFWEENSIIPSGTSFFTDSSYICTTCGRLMSKILLNESKIEVDSNQKTIDKAFSCKYCHSFYAPIYGRTLDSGSLYYVKVNPENYNDIIKQMDSCGRQAEIYTSATSSLSFTDYNHSNLTDTIDKKTKEENKSDKNLSVVKTNYSKIVGVTFEGRQQYVKQCKSGQRLTLIRDKYNQYDKNAIAVYNGNNQLGFIPTELAQKLAPKIDSGVEYRCFVLQITGGEKLNYGVNIKIEELR